MFFPRTSERQAEEASQAAEMAELAELDDVSSWLSQVLTRSDILDSFLPKKLGMQRLVTGPAPKPSRAAIERVASMWCSLTPKDILEDTTIQEAVLDAVSKKQRSRASLLRNAAGGMMPTENLVPFIDIPQDMVDDAWLDAALMEFGRPAFRDDRDVPASYFGMADEEDLVGEARRAFVEVNWIMDDDDDDDNQQPAQFAPVNRMAWLGGDDWLLEGDDDQHQPVPFAFDDGAWASENDASDWASQV
jgi:hypothetical protein